MGVRTMAENHVKLLTCVIVCACDLLRMIDDHRSFVAFSIEWYLRIPSKQKNHKKK